MSRRVDSRGASSHRLRACSISQRRCAKFQADRVNPSQKEFGETIRSLGISVAESTPPQDDGEAHMRRADVAQIARVVVRDHGPP